MKPTITLLALALVVGLVVAAFAGSDSHGCRTGEARAQAAPAATAR